MLLLFIPARRYEGAYDAETFSSLSTVFRTVGRFIMRSRHAV
jgi:hypothetical protein